jgi:hypothetical protein
VKRSWSRSPPQWRNRSSHRWPLFSSPLAEPLHCEGDEEVPRQAVLHREKNKCAMGMVTRRTRHPLVVLLPTSRGSHAGRSVATPTPD